MVWLRMARKGSWVYAICLVVQWVVVNEIRAASPGPVPDRVLVVLGASGEVDYGDQFRVWGDRWKAAFANRAVEVIDGTVPRNPTETVKEDRERVMDWITQANATALDEKESIATHWIVLIGHGTNDRTGAKFNLRGPDLADSELANALSVSLHRWVIVNCSSSSAPFLSSLSGPNRVVITATKSGAELNYSRFGDYFSQALSDASCDLDHDANISVLEAFLSASNRVARFYSDENRLASEQSLLDDNGDRKGTPAVFFKGLRPVKAPADGLKLDGGLASRVMIQTLGQPVQKSAAQILRIEQLQAEVELLRMRKTEMASDDYYDALEKLLLQLAELLVTE